MKILIIRIIAIVFLIALAYAHFSFLSPWLIAHGSSAAFNMMVGIWIFIVAGFVIALGVSNKDLL